MSDSLSNLCQRLGYRFEDLSLLRRAITHRSAGGDNNERLEFLGDAVLDLVIGESLFRRFPDATEGELTRLRSALVKGKTLALLARELTLGEFVRLGAGEQKSGGARRESILADTVEAIIGALYLEGGLEACRQRIETWFEDRLATVTLEVDEKDAKTRLQEFLQGRGLPLPDYQVINAEGDPHNQILTVACRIARVDTPFVASAASRKKAEKKTAQLALAHLQSNPHLYD